jgi:hypothetical protein
VALFPEDLKIRLEAIPALAVLVDTRIYPGSLPETPKYPALTFYTAQELPQELLTGGSGITKRRVQIVSLGRPEVARRVPRRRSPQNRPAPP